MMTRKKMYLGILDRIVYHIFSIIIYLLCSISHIYAYKRRIQTTYNVIAFIHFYFELKGYSFCSKTFWALFFYINTTVVGRKSHFWQGNQVKCFLWKFTIQIGFQKSKWPIKNNIKFFSPIPIQPYRMSKQRFNLF